MHQAHRHTSRVQPCGCALIPPLPPTQPAPCFAPATRYVTSPFLKIVWKNPRNIRFLADSANAPNSLVNALWSAMKAGTGAFDDSRSGLGRVAGGLQAMLEVYQAVKDIQNQTIATNIKFNVPVRVVTTALCVLCICIVVCVSGGEGGLMFPNQLF
jgi:hypothetical protein